MIANSPWRDIKPAASPINESTSIQISQQNISKASSGELKINSAKHGVVSKTNTSSSGLDTSIESVAAKREKLISAALRAVKSKDVEFRLYGIQVLAALEPGMAVSEIYQAFARLESEPNIEGMIILGALSLAHDKTHFGNDVILDIYKNTDSDNIKGRLARVLSFRGDDSLLVNYLSDIKPKLSKSEVSQRSDLLLMLGSVESKLTIPYLKPYLLDPDEDVRVSALTALSFSANEDELELVTPMLSDESEHVRSNAQLVVSYLTEKGKSMPLPVDIPAGLIEDENNFNQ
ncbi:MAG: HEAT repeat domain-containing protein [Pseudomonadota bacterium]